MPTLRGAAKHTILPNFPKNCMKLKEFGPPAGAGAGAGLASKILLCRSATGNHATHSLCQEYIM